MKLTEINLSSQKNISTKKSSLDNHENELRKQITDLQEKKKSISNDKDKTSEEKKKEKQAVQEEIQTLNSELRQYQVQKRQEEAAQKREELKEAAREADEKDADEKNVDMEQTFDAAKVFGNESSGVLISLSATKKQIQNMQRVRTHLSGRQRTASTDDEKASLQRKANNVAKNIGRKITITEDTVSKFRDSKKKGADAKQSGNQTYDWKAQSEIVNMTDDTEDSYHGNLAADRKKFFSTVSVFIR